MIPLPSSFPRIQAVTRRLLGGSRPRRTATRTGRPALERLEDRTLLNFGTEVPYSVGLRPFDVVVADLGNGHPDIVTTNYGDGTVSVLLGNGDGTFQHQVSYDVGTGPYGVAVADLNADGHPDIVTANSDDNKVSVLRGNGDGTFQHQVSYYDVGSMPYGVAVADLNADGDPDIVTANHGDDTVSVLLGNGDGTFRGQVSHDVGSLPFDMVVADLGNGHPDIVTVNHGDDTVSVLLGNGDGTFRDQVSYDVGAGPYGVAVADLNDDGHPDIVTTHLDDGMVSVLRGNGDGTFRAQVSYDVGSLPYGVAVADLNADGHPDIVTANRDDNTVTALLLLVLPTTTTITVPSSAKTYGDSIAFTATVSGSRTLTGKVQFVVDGSNFGSPVSVTDGQAVLTTSALAAGDHTINADYSGDSSNSPSASSDAFQHVNPAALTITATDASKTYGNANPALTYTYSPLVNGDTSSVFSGGLNTNATANSGAGPYAITQGALSAGSNYTITYQGGTLTVSPAALTVTASDTSKVQGQVNPALTGTITGLVNGDQVTPTYSTTATQSSTPGAYPITPAVSANSNYKITLVNGALTVTAAPLTPNQGDAIFVTALYRAILGHDPNPASLNSWVNRLLGGTSAGQMATTLWNSAEHRTLLRRHQAPALSYDSALSFALQAAQPVSVRPQHTAFVSTITREILGHSPSQASLNSWVKRLLAGTSQSQVARSIWNSSEHRILVKRHRDPQISFNSALTDAIQAANNA